MTKRQPKQPEHDAVYQVLKNMILFGEVIPGQPLTIMGLADALGASATPIREAIRRLTAERALETLENRRVAVPAMTHGKLEELEYLRAAVEPEIARRAVKNIEAKHIDELEEIDDQLDRAIKTGDIKMYLQCNHAFHFNLYQMAGCPTMLQVASSIWLQIGPALRVGCGRFGTANLTDQHEAAAEALRQKDEDAVAEAIRKDIAQGMDFVRQSLG